MENRGGNSVWAKMEELRLKCDREIQIQQQISDSATNSFHKSRLSATSKAQDTVQNLAKLGKLKAQLREVEDDLVKAIAVKTRNEAKRMNAVDSLTAAKARIEELKRFIEDQRVRKDEYAEIIYQQSTALAACEENRDRDTQCRGEIEEAMSWYNRVLGFQIECGHGVKFIFTNINLKNPNEEFSFTVRHENDIYSLLDCHPHLNDTKELINELNRSNGLFKFARTMREKFQEAAACGNFPQVTSLEQDSSTISASAPVSSISTDSRSESPAMEKEFELGEMGRIPKKVHHGKVRLPSVLSPGSTSYPRRSPRFKVKK